jgi:hypothetical protein
MTEANQIRSCINGKEVRDGCYNAVNFTPPAPVACVTLPNPATGALLSDVPVLIDTGTDATLLPSTAVEQLNSSCYRYLS